MRVGIVEVAGGQGIEGWARAGPGGDAGTHDWRPRIGAGGLTAGAPHRAIVESVHMAVVSLWPVRDRGRRCVSSRPMLMDGWSTQRPVDEQ